MISTCITAALLPCKDMMVVTMCVCMVALNLPFIYSYCSSLYPAVGSEASHISLILWICISLPRGRYLYIPLYQKHFLSVKVTLHIICPQYWDGASTLILPRYANWLTWFRLSTNQIVGFLVSAPTTVKLPHASGHTSGNRQGHVTKTITHHFEIFVALRFTNV